MTSKTARTTIADQISAFMPDLTRYARSLARNMTDADDLLQECLTRAITKSHLFRANTNLKAWLFTIMRNLHTSEMRRRGRAEIPVDMDQFVNRMFSLPDQIDRIMLTTVDKAFQTLPESQRQPLALVALDGLSSALLDVPVGTLKSRVSRGRAALRDILDEENLDETIFPHKVAA